MWRIVLICFVFILLVTYVGNRQVHVWTGQSYSGPRKECYVTLQTTLDRLTHHPAALQSLLAQSLIPTTILCYVPIDTKLKPPSWLSPYLHNDQVAIIPVELLPTGSPIYQAVQTVVNPGATIVTADDCTIRSRYWLENIVARLEKNAAGNRVVCYTTYQGRQFDIIDSASGFAFKRNKLPPEEIMNFPHPTCTRASDVWISAYLNNHNTHIDTVLPRTIAWSLDFRRMYRWYHDDEHRSQAADCIHHLTELI